ncbi:MAG TPA: hypothetical protein VGR28_08575 [Candidatus Thermoplasmatota archaeon]|nr:hypothetical protein [Candidatus Thermoplasmatota archaeon]
MRALAALLAMLALAPSLAALPHPNPDPMPNVVVLEPGWVLEQVFEGLVYPTSLAWRGGELLVIEQGRYPYAEPYAGQDVGKLRALTFGPDGAVVSARTLAAKLADPVGLTVGPAGDVWFTHFHGLARLPAESLDRGAPVVVPHSWAYPSQTSDSLYAPVTGTFINTVFGFTPDPLAGDTTGPMGIAFDGQGRVLVAQGAHGRPPDDDGVRDVTGLDYDNPYSSSVLAPPGGPLAPGDVVARGCRNCYDLAFAPPGNPHAGTLFITENVGPYRARLYAGANRSLLAGSTATDVNALDGVDVVDFATRTFRRAATFRPDGLLLGASPTGIAFAPPETPKHAHAMFVALWSGFTPSTQDRGEVAIVNPDPEHGLGVATPFVIGLDFPTDVAFGPDGALYVVEYASGRLWRVAPGG